MEITNLKDLIRFVVEDMVKKGELIIVCDKDGVPDHFECRKPATV